MISRNSIDTPPVSFVVVPEYKKPHYTERYESHFLKDFDDSSSPTLDKKNILSRAIVNTIVEQKQFEKNKYTGHLQDDNTKLFEYSTVIQNINLIHSPPVEKLYPDSSVYNELTSRHDVTHGVLQQCLVKINRSYYLDQVKDFQEACEPYRKISRSQDDNAWLWLKAYPRLMLPLSAINHIAQVVFTQLPQAAAWASSALVTCNTQHWRVSWNHLTSSVIQTAALIFLGIQAIYSPALAAEQAEIWIETYHEPTSHNHIRGLPEGQQLHYSGSQQRIMCLAVGTLSAIPVPLFMICTTIDYAARFRWKEAVAGLVYLVCALGIPVMTAGELCFPSSNLVKPLMYHSFSLAHR